MFVTEQEYWVRQEHYADLRRQAQQQRLTSNQRREPVYWRSLLTQGIDIALGIVSACSPETAGNRSSLFHCIPVGYTQG
ncbi:MAG: hypothetical protein AAF702_45785 [Chloroflexota bacterium]